MREPDFDVKASLHQLRQALPYVPPIPVASLITLHRARDYKGLVELIRKTMNVEVNLRVAWVNSGGPETAPAWIVLPERMPFYGSEAFRKMTITMYIRKSFLAESSYEQAAMAISHELSHVVLESIGHSLRKMEKVVDLTAMLLGFRILFKSGCYRESHIGNFIHSQKLGYLSPEEVHLADKLLAQDEPVAQAKRVREPDAGNPHVRMRRLASWRRAAAIVSAFSAAALVAAFFGAQAAQAISKTLQVRQTLLANRADIQLPMKLDDKTTWTGVDLGLTSWTSILETDMVKDSLNVAALETEARKSICGTKYRLVVDSGASYSYEYRNASGAVLGRFSIASCP
jgi:hypothetical protein